MNKWDAINEGGEGYRPTVKETRPTLYGRLALLERKDSINRKIAYTSTKDLRYAALIAELDAINQNLAK